MRLVDGRQLLFEPPEYEIALWPRAERVVPAMAIESVKFGCGPDFVRLGGSRDEQADNIGPDMVLAAQGLELPVLVTRDEIPNPNALTIATILNGERVQDWSTNDMIFDVSTLIEFLSGSTTLPAGTVIFTGTPHGVGMARTPPRWLRPGDSMTVAIEQIGELTNPVVLEGA